MIYQRSLSRARTHARTDSGMIRSFSEHRSIVNRIFDKQSIKRYYCCMWLLI